jgi:Cu/Ag efflux protein CusF
MKSVKIGFAMVLAVCIAFSSVAFGEQGSERRPAREKWDNMEIQATIHEIDLESRKVVLVGPEGNLVTLAADDRVKRLEEFKVGDLVHASYWSYMMAEFRDPTPEELAQPFVKMTETTRMPDEMDPGAVLGAVVKAVVTIEGVNRPFKAVTVKGPNGNYLTIPVKDDALLGELNIGEVVIMTYSESIALSLEKVRRLE